LTQAREDTRNPLGDSAVFDVWLDCVKHLWTITFSIVPILLNQYGKYNTYAAVGYGLLFIAVVAVVPMPQVHVIYNLSVTFLCATAAPSTNVIAELMGPVLSLVVMFFLMLLADPMIQLVGIVFCMGFFVWMIKEAFYSRRPSNSVGLIIFLLQFLVCYEGYNYIRTRWASNSASGLCYGMVLNSLFPNGYSVYWHVNASALSEQFAKFTSKYLDPRLGFLFTFVIQFFCVIVFRTCIGVYSLTSLRYSVDPDAVFGGFVVYFGDLFGGVTYLVKWAFNEALESKKDILCNF
jgi:hypothetical protein